MKQNRKNRTKLSRCTVPVVVLVDQMKSRNLTEMHALELEKYTSIKRNSQISSQEKNSAIPVKAHYMTQKHQHQATNETNTRNSSQSPLTNSSQFLNFETPPSNQNYYTLNPRSSIFQTSHPSSIFANSTPPT